MYLNQFLEQFNTGSSNGGGFEEINFLKLQNDRDSAVVKILITNEDDIMNYVKKVHKVTLGKYDNYVLCKDEECECCKAGLKAIPKIAIPVYNFDTKRVEMWIRGLAQINQVASLMEEYDTNLTNVTFKIVRSGAKGSTDTTYSFMYQMKDRKLPDGVLDQIPKVTGRNYKLFLDLTPSQQTQAMIEGKVDWKADNVVSKEDKEGVDEIPF